MGRVSLSRLDLNRHSLSWLCWVAVLVASIVIMALFEHIETDILSSSIQLDQLYTFRVGAYANLLLVASTVLYLWHTWSHSEAAGKWASDLAALATLGLLLSLVTRWIETYYLHRPGHVPLNGLYEMMASFSVITVLIYLVMERVYEVRSAGAFVMIIVLASVLFQIWLVATGQAVTGNHIPMLRSYWMYAHVLGNFVGYGAFAVAAAMGGAFLFRSRAEQHHQTSGFAICSLPDLQRIDRSMHHAVLLGFPLFTIATILGAMWAYEAWGRYWAWDPQETWAVIIWLVYASYFCFRYIGKWSGQRMAWWSIIGFGITVFYFLGVRMLWPGLHA